MELQTDRLILREYAEDDWRVMLAYQSQPDYGTYYETQVRDEASTRAFLGHFIAWQQEQPRRRYQMAVVLRETGVLIGSCGLRLGGIEERIDHSAHEGILGYDLDPTQWGHGYATEAAHALLRFGFETLGLHRVWTYHVADNRRSERVMERLGFTQEGLLRENERMQGRWWDTCVHGLLADEWRATQASRT
jgi:RimJ/RimL family protein N-acetyltransferase